jgi:hypothetical protein
VSSCGWDTHFEIELNHSKHHDIILHFDKILLESEITFKTWKKMQARLKLATGESAFAESKLH